ncbi:MAG: ABC transporter ATP-binding protein [Mycoplasmataceae bacterium]|jgi:ABC-2 type transport system ATP-binding protein|nr:ABC transporter ATP-binding protein [Mycoplasmataceae bacterium]
MNKQIINKKKILIEVKSIKKDYGRGKKKFTAIENLSFNIYENENVSIVGANGAGKTTTVEIMMGITKPTSGRIIYNFGKKKDNINKMLGIQFQDSIYPSYISVKSIINFIIDSYKINITDDELGSLVKAFKVDGFYNKDASSLSGGQSQRLNIFLALLHKPKVVFLDELSTGLDITTRNEFKLFIKKYASENRITIILISHDANEIISLTDRILILKKGEIKNDKKINEFKNANELEKYIGENIN